MAVNYGQVAIVPKGVWNAEAQYKVNNLVEYDGSSYVAKVQPPVGTLPTDTSYWQVSAAGTKKATPDSLGTVMPDGTTTEIKEDGKLSAKTAQQNALGVVKGSDDIIVGEDGNLTVNTTFEQATEIANIIAGEAIKSVLGKVSKAIATTMSLDENALLKNMISGIDVNDGSKVPSSAYIHSLVERIGMGTALEGGFDNLTAGLNSVNNNLSNTNSRLDTSLSSSVLDYALTLPEGMHTVRFPGDGYTGADTPNSYYRYSSATIIVRSKGKIVTVLLYGISTKAPLAVNSYDGGKWNGWDQYVTKNDLLISASGTGPTDWTALETVENMPFKIWNVTKARTSKGAPAGCYDYGTLIALVANATGDRWRNTLIYLPNNNNNVENKVYVRTGISTKWLAISGTDVNSVS